MSVVVWLIREFVQVCCVLKIDCVCVCRIVVVDGWRSSGENGWWFYKACGGRGGLLKDVQLSIRMLSSSVCVLQSLALTSICHKSVEELIRAADRQSYVDSRD